MTEIRQIIQEALVRSRGIRRKRAGLAAIAAFAGVMALMAVLDRAWMFDGPARWAGWIGGLAVAVVAAWRAAGSECHDEQTLAHQVEAEAGETTPVVATAIDPAVREASEREALAGIFLERLDRRAEEALRIAPPSFQGRLRIPAALVVAAGLALVAVVLVQGSRGLLRMMLPWQESPYTSLSLEGPAGILPEGQDFTLTVRVTGVPVGKVTLYRLGSAVPLAEAAPDGQGVVRLAVDGLDGPADFMVGGGDGQSDPLRVEPYLLPSIEEFEIVVTPPTYAAHAGFTESEPSFAALRGSDSHYRIRLKAPATSVSLEQDVAAREEEWVKPEERDALQTNVFGQPIGAEEPAAKKPGLPVFHPDPGDPLVWETDWDFAEPGDIVYRLVIKGDQGDVVRNDEAWRINVLPDAPPTVKIEGHNGDEVIKTGNEEVSLDLRAVDDVALAEARLIFRKPGGPHSEQVIVLPKELRRAWSGAELLALAPFELRPLDLLAVHAEVVDGNTLDGPGVGRSEVVFLEIPLPEAEDDGGGEGGGGGGGGSEPINPLELQKEILRATISLPDDAPSSEQEALAYDQRQNAEYVGMMEQMAIQEGAAAFVTVMQRARFAMETATETLEGDLLSYAVPAEERALAALIDAAKMIEEGESGLPMDGEAGDDAMKFTLRSSPPKGGTPSKTEDEAEKDEQDLRDLVKEVERQLAEQQELNKAAGQKPKDGQDAEGGQEGEEGELADQQKSLAEKARDAAAKARGMSGSEAGAGDPEAAAEDLERAAGLQEDASEALAGGKAESGSELGEESAEALAEALNELAAQLRTNTDDGEGHPPGYERLINDYLRSISYE